MPLAKLAEHLIGGVARAEVPFEPIGLLGRFCAPANLLMPPMPNTLFTRDNSCWIGDDVVLCPMFWPACRQETLLMAAIHRLHPPFAKTTKVWWGDPDQDHGVASLEGGARGAMHMDTAFSFCDRDLATIFPEMVDAIRVHSLRPGKVAGTLDVRTETKSPA